MRHLIFFIIPLLLIQPGCSSDNQNTEEGLKVIDVAGGVGKSRLVNLSEIADTIEYIPLETNQESLLAHPPHERILYEKDILYFPQKRGIIKLFNSKGEYLSTFNRLGRGPQEYEQFGELQIDNVSGKIIILSINKVLEYSPNGECIRNIFLPAPNMIDNKSIGDFIMLGDNYFFLDGFKYPVIITDSSLNVIKRLKYPPEDVDLVKVEKSIPRFATSYIYLYKDRIRLINGINKYVLSINKDLSVDTVFIINYGKYSPENTKSGSRNSLNYTSPYLWRYGNVLESDNYLFMRFHLGSLSDKPYKMHRNWKGSVRQLIDPNACALFNKETEEFTFLDQPEIDQMGFVDDIEGGPAIWPKYVSADNYMVSYILAEEFIAHAESHKVSEKFKKIADGLKETDNYVFVRVKLKTD
ncbi:MAG: 6-bladed beta-propeller [Bacteroidales bacterium]|nr:6-bladed beta-propeller [Bacteroidales bacterium]MDD3989421.1 6-bladed beta-propeller [Bacteroidales bacterium]MDD4639542.1 6-bladed beta-propeller [Bacteroidales bacterium]